MSIIYGMGYNKINLSFLLQGKHFFFNFTFINMQSSAFGSAKIPVFWQFPSIIARFKGYFLIVSSFLKI